MKKLVVVFALLALAFTASATNELSYVIVKGKPHFSQDARMGISGVKMTYENGTTLRVPFRMLDVAFVNGKIYERLPLICINGREKCTALLELISFRNGLRLYSLKSNDSSLGCCFTDEYGSPRMYFVYKGQNLYLRVDEKNISNVFSFFERIVVEHPDNLAAF